jgi:hypothetical protein
MLAIVVGGAGLFVAEILAYPPVHHGGDRPDSAGAFLGFVFGLAVIYVAMMAAIAIHELGHYLALRLLGHQPKAIYIGAPPKLIKAGRATPVYLGLVPRGRVQWGVVPSSVHVAVTLLAGPVANLVTAPLALLLPLDGTLGYSVALIFALAFLTNLLPYRMRTGGLSDGAALLRLPARVRSEREVRLLLESQHWPTQPGATDTLLRGWRLDVRAARQLWHELMHLLRNANRTRDLFEVHHMRLGFPDSPSRALVQAIHHAEWLIATVPGLPLAEANLAGRRLAWVLQHCGEADRAAVWHSLAVIRFRQGLLAEVEPLCADALGSDLPSAQRATVLATVAMARHATGLSGREALDEALALDRDAELVNEAITRLGTRPPARVKTRRR